MSFYIVINFLGVMLVNIYIISRLNKAFTYNEKTLLIIKTVVFFTSVCWFLSIICIDKLPGTMAYFVCKVGIIYFGIMSFLVLLYPCMDLLKFISHKILKARTINFYKWGSICIVVVMIYGAINSRIVKTSDYEVFLNKNLQGHNINIVMISDTHLGYFINEKRLESLVHKINNEKPDMVVISGDIIDSSIKPFLDRNMGTVLSKLKSTYGTYAVLGNHDISRGYEDKLCKNLKDNGIKVLRDECVLVDNKFYIIGREDVTKKNRKELKEIISNVDREKPLILLDHNPRRLTESFAEDIDLQLSGHTHGGQYYPYSIFIDRDYDIRYGEKNIDNFTVVVSSGTGTWGPPFRIGSKSEIVNIKLY